MITLSMKSVWFFLFLIFATNGIRRIVKNVTEFFCVLKKEVGIFEGCEVLSLSQYWGRGRLKSWDMLSNKYSALQAQRLGKETILSN